MNKTDCKFEPVSNVTIGIILMIIGLLFTLIGIVIIPVVGLLIALPVLIIAGVFLASPRSKACAIIADKTRGAVNR
jgi:hypothetical protein